MKEGRGKGARGGQEGESGGRKGGRGGRKGENGDGKFESVKKRAGNLKVACVFWSDPQLGDEGRVSDINMRRIF